MRLRQLAPIAAVLVLVTTGLSSNPPNDGPFEGCPIKGKGGDETLNTLKNRSAPATDSTTRSPSAIADLEEPGVTNRLPRDQWTSAQRKIAARHETQSVLVEGFLVGFKQEGIERCNCSKDTLNDYHLWLADRGDLTKAEAVVVEATPRWRGANPTWTKATLSRLKTKRTKVRITGWLLYDQEHLNEIGNSRASVWEVHPITKIEIFTVGEWQEL